MPIPESPSFSIVHDCGELADAVGDLLRQAFRARYGSGDGEVAIARALRANRQIVAEAAAVGECGVLGYAVMSGMSVDPPERRIAALGPVAVHIARQNAGIGSALIRSVLSRCANRGFGGAVVLGDVSYYRRFGFDPALVTGVCSPYSGPHLQGLEFVPGALKGVRSVAYASAFDAV